MTVSWTLFDRLAPNYDQVIPFFAGFAAHLLDVVDPSPGTRLLDVGSGRGAIAAAAGPAGRSPDRRRRCRRTPTPRRQLDLGH